MQKVKHVSYIKNSNGDTILSSPVYLPLTRQKVLDIKEPTLCKIERYENTTLASLDNEFEEYKVCNTYFTIIPQRYSYSRRRRPAVFTFPHINMLNELYIEYTSKNPQMSSYLKTVVVKQANSRIRYNRMFRKREVVPTARNIKKRDRINKRIPEDPEEKAKREYEEKLAIMKAKQEGEEKRRAEEQRKQEEIREKEKEREKREEELAIRRRRLRSSRRNSSRRTQNRQASRNTSNRRSTSRPGRSGSRGRSGGGMRGRRGGGGSRGGGY